MAVLMHDAEYVLRLRQAGIGERAADFERPGVVAVLERLLAARRLVRVDTLRGGVVGRGGGLQQNQTGDEERTVHALAARVSSTQISR